MKYLEGMFQFSLSVTNQLQLILQTTSAQCDCQRYQSKRRHKQDTRLIDGLLKVMESLIFLLFLFVLVDLEVAQFVAFLGVRHDPQPVSEVVLLQVLLGQILQVPARTQNGNEEMMVIETTEPLQPIKGA